MVLKDALVFLIEEVPDLLHHRHGIGLFFGILAQINQNIKQLIHIGHVEVACHHKVAAAPVVLSQEGVAALDGVFAMGAVAQVSQPQLTTKAVVLLEPLGIVVLFLPFFACFAVLLGDLIKDHLDRL